MKKTVGIGHQNFEQIITEDIFYIDKTMFIKEWWENKDSVTLITRPRRFGKTLTLSMTESFFSVEYAEKAVLFEGLQIWQDEKYRRLQGTYPVISLSFANIKEKDYLTTRQKICYLLTNLYAKNSFLLDSGCLYDADIRYFKSVSPDMDDSVATLALNRLSEFLYRYYGKKVIILLDEYDTPMQEAYVNGYLREGNEPSENEFSFGDCPRTADSEVCGWEELVCFTRSLFNAAFKTNLLLERGLMTGITRVSKESIFSDLNNLTVVTTTSDLYADIFGFTEKEVSEALQEYGLQDQMELVKSWYDGFVFGTHKDIYNPWSILNYLKTEKVSQYWANTSSNSLVGKLLRGGSSQVKEIFEDLLKGKTFCTQIDEQIVYNQLDENESAIWSLLLASGYLKVKRFWTGMTEFGDWEENYELELTNFEMKVMFRNMIRGWFTSSDTGYNDFVKAMMQGDLDAMNAYMNRISESVFSFFDTGKHPSRRAEPERFYHGFVLGLMMDLNSRYLITSNRESGFGRYDVMLEPRKDCDDAILLEFKVKNPVKERTLQDTVDSALAQIEERDYAVSLREKGIPADRIRKYGIAFEGKTILIGQGA